MIRKGSCFGACAAALLAAVVPTPHGYVMARAQRGIWVRPRSVQGRPARSRTDPTVFVPELGGQQQTPRADYVSRRRWHMQNTLAFARGVVARALRLNAPGEALQAQRIVRRCQQQIKSLEIGSAIAPELFWMKAA